MIGVNFETTQNLQITFHYYIIIFIKVTNLNNKLNPQSIVKVLYSFLWMKFTWLTRVICWSETVFLMELQWSLKFELLMYTVI